MLKYSFILLLALAANAQAQINPNKNYIRPAPDTIYSDWSNGRQTIIINAIGAWMHEVNWHEMTQPRAMEWSMLIPAPHNPLIFRDTTGKIIAQYNGAQFKSKDFRSPQNSPKIDLQKYSSMPRHRPPLFITHGGQRAFYVYKGNLIGLVNSQGEIILDFKYPTLFQNGENLYFCTKEGKTGLLGPDLKVAMPAEYTHFHRLEANPKLFVVSNYRTYGLIDERGQVVLSLDYLGGFNFHEGTAVVVSNKTDSLGQQRHLRGVINTDGHFIVPCTFEDVHPFLKQNFTAAKLNGKWGLINRKGETIAPFQYDYVGPFIDGLASVRNGEYYGDAIGFGFVDSTGRELISPTTYRYLGYPQEGLCTACRDRDCGYVDLQGREVTPFHFSNVWDFKNGKAQVTYQQKTRYINRKGEFID